MRYHWPGNVRELENCVERAVLLAHDGVVRSVTCRRLCRPGVLRVRQRPLETVVAAFEREVLIEAMKNAHGNMAAAARALETTPRILAYKLKNMVCIPVWPSVEGAIVNETRRRLICRGRGRS